MQYVAMQPSQANQRSGHGYAAGTASSCSHPKKGHHNKASTLVNLTFASDSNAAELPSTADLTEHLQDMPTFSPSEEVELASTEEVLDLFSRYFDADSADANSRNVQDSIKTDLDFNSKVFEPNYASQPAASPLEHTQGGHTDTFDVRQFVAG